MARFVWIKIVNYNKLITYEETIGGLWGWKQRAYTDTHVGGFRF
jgi:hypothetical protein